ncbi:hypothetical protein COCSADRAFT_322101 [Bipolaris sorokiniana ND90Pr]|uniref:Secreted protein n=1 Tax=Cochliobolus sativus (strain ND90Pr / ATCC 201652) TaxID=665912 RepID=M2SPE8_COCSN|nr:uncharacterized protein COCSADRAFT_322101 [Bipolaris sorokiniana ND90Pr]EMD64175.1 hypothetical protein COCSADRAFT_322101 [Bipolaris sorokiniana ND90Pr]
MRKWLELHSTLHSLVASLLTLLGRQSRQLCSIHVQHSCAGKSACLLVFTLTASGQRPRQLRHHIKSNEARRHGYTTVNPRTYSKHLDWIVKARSRAVESAMTAAVPVRKPPWRLRADLSPRP